MAVQFDRHRIEAIGLVDLAHECHAGDRIEAKLDEWRVRVHAFGPDVEFLCERRPQRPEQGVAGRAGNGRRRFDLAANQRGDFLNVK